jgi:Protein of unknown function (DUF1572)
MARREAVLYEPETLSAQGATGARCVRRKKMAHKFTTSYLQDSLALLRQYKKMAEGAMAQVTDDQLTAVLDPEMNSIALIVKHITGNMRSRWTDFLTSDGEKPNRNRDSEFMEPPATREQLMAGWNDGWELVFGALEPLSDDDLGRTVTIRGEPHSVMQAINRQIAHYAAHVGQIVFLAKHLQHTNWKSLSVPRGKSIQFTSEVLAGEKSQR